MKKALLLLGCAGAIAQVSAQNWLDTGNPGVGLGTNFLGAINNAPIDIRTNNTQRFRVNHNVSYTIGSFGAQAKNGALGLSPNNTLWTSGPGPFSRLHLHDGTSSVLSSPYRPWMDNGITFTTNSDQMYIGHKVESGTDQTAAVIQWGDNDAPAAGPDVLKFLFAAGYTGGTYGVGGLNGRELGRFHPQGWFGIGDWQSAGLQPDERLDLRDRTIRLRSFAHSTLYRNDTYDRVLVANPSDGRVYWRAANTLGGACSSGWNLQGNNAVTAYNGNPCIPQSPDRVGIGTSVPSAKLHIASDVLGTGGSYTAVRIDNLTPSVDDNGIDYIGVEAHTADITWPPNPNSVFYYGGRFTATNATKANIGVEGVAQSTGSFQSPLNIGVKGTAHPSTSGTAYGVYGISSGAGNAGYFLNSGGGTALVVDGDTHLSGTLFISGSGWVNGGTPIISDQNLKHDIEDLGGALELVQQLHPKRYQYNIDEFPFLGLPEGERMGLLAQEVEQVLPGLVHSATFPELRDSLGIVVHDSLPLKGIDYTELVPLLIGAIQEQNVRLDALEAQLDQCCAAQNPGMASEVNGGMKSAPAKKDVQEQRLVIHPNPFTDHTTLSYFVPQAGKVSLQVSTSDGKPLGTLREEQAEAGAFTYEWNTSRLASGTYFCTFMLDGNVVVKRAVKVAR